MIGPFIQQFVGNVVEGGNVETILEQLLKSDFCKLQQNYVCDGCNSSICGTRFHCTDCQDFDFCSTCYEQKKQNHNESHKFEEINAVTALKEALKNNNIFIDTFLAPGKATEPSPKNEHRALCDRCDQQIVGIRWKCFECDNFDFCNTCYLESAGKETIKDHQKEHCFAKIEEPEQISSFPSLLAEFNNKKKEEINRNEFLAKIEQKNKEEEELISELERKKKLLEERIEEEIRKRKEYEIQFEKESIELLSQQEQEENKVNAPFEQKLEALQSMGFVDRQKNIKLLLQHKGELVLAIQDLLN